MSQCCEGSWLDCINPFHNPVHHTFFRHIPKCMRFNRNDVAKICPLCWDEAQRRNGTLKTAPRGNSDNAWRDHLRENKPEKDSL